MTEDFPPESRQMREERKKRMRDIVFGPWDKQRQEKIDKLIDNNLKNKKGRHRKP